MKALQTKTFYDEYLAVLDIVAQFSLQTTRIVFHDNDLGRNALTYHIQAGLGHDGVFSGRRWEVQVCPLARNSVLAND